MSQRKELPIGIQNFKEIRDPRKNYIYVDKTKAVHTIVNQGKYFFLSRPRRFGKSLFVDTLNEVFNGNKASFEGLYIYDKHNWEETNPVVRIDFSSGDFSTEASLKHVFSKKLEENCKANQLQLSEIEDQDHGIYLGQLIRALHEKYNQQVVVLIDEYDKPIIDNIGRERSKMASVARDALKNLYGAFKYNDALLRLVFITGVSKFSKLSLFSGANNIVDITMHRSFATVAGYTQVELEHHFAAYLGEYDKEEIKSWYNGYNYFGDPIYNPYDILLFFYNYGEFSNYWWETGNPSFLIEKLKEKPISLPKLDNISASKNTLNAFDIDHIELVALLWQTGYLTFSGRKVRPGNTTYYLKVPNLEVQSSLHTLFLNYLTNGYNENDRRRGNITDAFLANDLTAFKEQLVALFASIPYSNYTKNNMANFEGYYASVIYAFVCSLGFEVRVEDNTSTGRVDMTLIGPEQIYILEFKVDQSAESALHQITTRKYYQKYNALGKEIYLIGMKFDSKERTVEELVWEELK